MNASGNIGARLLTSAALTALSVVLVLSGCRKPVDRPVYVVPLEAPGPTKLHYDLETTIDSKLTHLRGLAVDKSGRIFAVGTGGVNILDEQGKLLAHWERTEDVHCVAIGEDGTIYLGGPGRIIKLDSGGSELASWTTVGAGGRKLGHVTSLAVRGIELLAADADARCIHRLTVDGDFSNEIGGTDPGTPRGGLIVPSDHLDCAFNSDGKVVISHPGRLRVEIYTLDGKLESNWGEPGMEADHFCGCCNPTDIAIAPDGNVVTSEKGIFRVKVYDPNGKMLAYISPEQFSGKEPGLDLAVDQAGRICVADPGDGRIRVFALSAVDKRH